MNQLMVGQRIEQKVINRYPFAQMKVGDFFEVDIIDPNQLKRMRSAASMHGLLHQKRFSIKWSHPIKKTYRCWRIA